MKTLSTNKNKIIVKPNKAIGVAILNTIDYKNKMCDILNNKTKFNVRHNDFSSKREVILNNLLRKISKNGCISKHMYKELYSIDAGPKIMYGLPKTHKQNIPSRPIISSIDTFLIKLRNIYQNFLVRFLLIAIY